MRSTMILAVAFLLAAVSRADPTDSLPGVVDLTPENFDTYANGGRHVLAEFYAPWCGHCKSLTPEYKKLGEMIMADPKLSTRVVIAKANADSHRSLGEKFDVKGFPSINWLPRGKPATKDHAEDYNGARNAEGFMKYILEKLEADKSFAQVESLAPIAAKFAAAEDKKALVAEVKAALATLEGEDKSNGEIYVKVMEKAAEKADYMAKEKARLDKMLATGSLSAAKMDEMGRKASILGALLGEE